MLLQVIVFSKDRPLQLEALLRSMGAHMLVPRSCHVLFTASFEAGYEELMRARSDVDWFQETFFTNDPPPTTRHAATPRQAGGSALPHGGGEIRTLDPPNDG